MKREFEVILDTINNDGFTLSKPINSDEYDAIKSLVESQWRNRILKCYPYLEQTIKNLEMDAYHELDNLLEHKLLWPKKERVLDSKAVSKIKSMSFFKTLANELNVLRIANEESMQPEEIYWRIVRPDSRSDIGPLHADSWFWELGHGVMPEGCFRVKVWLALYCELNLSGLGYVENSHKRSWPYIGVLRDGFIKPQIQIDETKVEIKQFNIQPGQYVAFHDNLLHVGIGGGLATRVNLEFTLLCEK
ncbi:phytanoyl-CoA dioxygenase family protein [Catenovulum sediminis]|uniref:phytanoyl-CoA dioxygenase family protein n=1 Tax=Catenovulum sediminis TaxID=1740262 RepID=UPI00117DF837|nr:phytanoyl-CoA dioxygenase family protein [Catenovulum sediminis]